MRLVATSFLFAMVAAGLIGCGVARVQAHGNFATAGAYRSVFVEPVEVRSKEQTPKALELNDQIALAAYGEIQAAISKGRRYRLLGAGSGEPGTLVVKTSIEVTYGSRALRYFVPGAGAGSVISTMEVLDAVTLQLIVRAVSRSELAVGIYGGSMDSTISDNLLALIHKSGLGEDANTDSTNSARPDGSQPHRLQGHLHDLGSAR